MALSILELFLDKNHPIEQSHGQALSPDRGCPGRTRGSSSGSEGSPREKPQKGRICPRCPLAGMLTLDLGMLREEE